MTERTKSQTSRGFSGLRKLSSLVKETRGVRGFGKKSRNGGKRQMSTAPLSKLELPTDLREFSFDYSDGNSFRYSFMGSDFDSDTTNTQTNRFSFVSSVFDKEIEPQLDGGRARVHQVIPDIDDDLEASPLPQIQPEKRKSKLTSFYGISSPPRDTIWAGPETPKAMPRSPAKKREPLTPVTRQVLAKPIEHHEKRRQSKINVFEPKSPHKAAHSCHKASVSDAPSDSVEDALPQEASVVAVTRYSVPPALTIKPNPDSRRVSPVVTPQEPVKRRHQIRMDGLLKPIGSSENPEARRVAQQIEQMYLHSSKPQGAPAASVAAIGKRSSVADIRQSLLAKAESGQASENIPPTSSVTIGQPTLRNSKSMHPEAGQRYSTPVPLTQPTASTLQSSAKSGASARRNSSTSRTADRLAWLHELEEKNKNPGRDMVFQKLHGGVAAKLARFESQNIPLHGRVAQASSPISRTSDAYSIEAGSSSAASRILSNICSPASTVGTSGTVMSNFDAGFKAKMESLAGNLAGKAHKENEPEALARTTAGSMVPGKPKDSKYVSKDVIDIIRLSGTDTEVAVNDYVGHGNFGRTRTMEEELKKLNKLSSSTSQYAAPRPKRRVAPLNTSVPTIESLLNTPPSTPPPRDNPSPTLSASSSPTGKAKAQASAAGLSIVVAQTNSSASPATPTRLLLDINSPPCVAAFSTLSSNALPLAKDEMTPHKIPAGIVTGGPASERFNPAALPLFVRV